MDLAPRLTERVIRQSATPESYQRGLSYCEQGAVASVVCRGGQLTAEVWGSQDVPYRVRVTFDASGITTVTCTCPYDWGGWCKHIVATLLTCLHAPEIIQTRPTLEELVTGLDREQLKALLLDLQRYIPNLVDQIENHLAVLQAVPPASGSAQVGTPASVETSRALPVRHGLGDARLVRRKAHAMLHSLDHMRQSEAYWQVDTVVDGIRQLLNETQALLQGGDVRDALPTLEELTAEYVQGWTCLDDSNGYAGEFFAELGAAWTEAMLTADLTPTERQEWAHKLDVWQRAVDKYGVEDAFETAQLAAEQGWATPTEQQVCHDGASAREAMEHGMPGYSDNLVIARLTILERQGRTEEYLRMAKAEHQMALYVAMLARLGRVQDAVVGGIEYLKTANEALEVARALRPHDAAAALRMAEHGLTLGGYKQALAGWLCDAAAELGDTRLALQATVVLFRETPSLDAYLQVQSLAADRWPELRTELFDCLRSSNAFNPQAQVDIFLHEGLLDEAIRALGPVHTVDLLARVVDAATECRPDWAIQRACQQAELIIDAGRSQHYEDAIGWLERARRAYRAAGRASEWETYLERIRNRHARKYRLMEMLQRLEA